MADILSADTRTLRDALAQFPSGVVALCAVIDGEPIALIASTFTVGVSEQPPLVLVSIQHRSTTWPKLRSAQTIGVSVLGEDHQMLCRQLASRDHTERFTDIKTTTTPEGAVFICGSPLQLTCTKYLEVPSGDHDVVILRIEDYASDIAALPLVFHRSGFARVLPGAP